MDDPEQALIQLTYCPLCGILLNPDPYDENAVLCPSGHGTFTVVRIESAAEVVLRFDAMFTARLRLPLRIGNPPY